MKYLKYTLLAVGMSIVGALVALSFIYPKDSAVEVGAQNPVGGEVYYLSGSGISSSASSVGLTRFGYTQPDGTYYKFTMTNFGTLGCATIQPGNASGKQEFVSFTGVTQNANGSATLTGVSRGLMRFYPFTASTTLQTSHAGASQVSISNSPPCFYESYANTKNNDVFTGNTMWASTSYPGYVSLPTSHSLANYASSTAEFASVGYVNAVSIAGAANATEAVKGIVELATAAESASSTILGATGAGAVQQAKYATDTPQFCTTQSCDVWAQIGGKIRQSWLNLAEPFTWTAHNIFSSTFSTRASSTNATTTALDVTGLARFTGSGTTTFTGGITAAYITAVAATTTSFSAGTADGASAEATALCVSPKIVVGGGHSGVPQVLDTAGNLGIQNVTFDGPSGNGWKVTVVCHGKSAATCNGGTVTVYAMCSNP